jgi:hypothetical protein
MDAYTRNQYDDAEDKLDEAITAIDEIWQEASNSFTNRPVSWQRSEEGEAEQARLFVMDNLIHELHAAAECLSGLFPVALVEYAPATPSTAPTQPKP